MNATPLVLTRPSHPWFGASSSIGRRVAVMIIAFSTAVMLVISAAQLAFEYRALRRGLESQLDNVNAYLANIASSVWHLDDPQIQLALRALQQQPHLEQASVVTSDTSRRWNAGAAVSKNQIVRVYDLRVVSAGREFVVGKLSVVGSIDALRQELLARAVWVLIANGLTIFCIALYILLLLRRRMTQRLEVIAGKLRLLQPAGGPAQTAVPGQAKTLPEDMDDLDLVEWSLETTARQLQQTAADLASSNAGLKESEERLRLALEAADMGTFDWDLPGNRITWSPQLERLAGLPEGGFPGTYPSFAEHVHPEDIASVDEEVRRCMAVREPFAREFRFVLPDGHIRWVTSVGRFAMDNAGVVVRMRGLVMDSTTRRRNEDEIRQLNANLEQRVAERTAQLEAATLQAEGATRAKSAFLANMSHEIRTPMNAIVGLSFLLSREIHDPRQRDRLAKIGSAAQHLLQVINDILDLSKIEAGKMTLEEADFSLDDLLVRAFGMVAAPARDKNLELVLETDHLPSRLRGDPTRLAQALINLLGNAVKFTDHGWVRVSGELQRQEGSRLQVRFEVTDTGDGIAADRQALLFQSFEQADASITRLHGGTGLGLALTRHIARLMGGEAGVVSDPGRGSTFWFTAWLQTAQSAEAKAVPLDTRGLRALVVDDLPEARDALGERLQMMGFEVDTLPCGVTAVECVKDEAAAGRAYDVLLVDWQMTPIDGIETLRRLRQMLGARMPPAILVSSFDTATARQALGDMPIAGLLSKPVTASALHDVLARVLGKPAPPNGSPPTAPGKAESQVRRLHAGRRLLVVDDHMVNQEVAQAVLQTADLQVELANHGAEALELAMLRPFDLILMDIQMPVMDGLTAARALREAGVSTTIVAMTANAFSEDRAACLAAGMDDHIAKPFDPETLYEKLLQWLPGEAVMGNAGAPARPAHAAAAATPAPPSAADTENPRRLTLQHRLALIDGYDVTSGLRNVGEDAATLEQVLQVFVDTYQQGSTELIAGDAATQVTRWRAAAHSLRGAASAIGAEQLAAQVTDFERQLDTPDAEAPRAEAAERLQEALLTLTQRLRAELAAE